MSHKSKRGFTLIELLVVIAIIAILAAILFPVFAKAREKARQITCASNEKQMGVGILMYAQDYDETMVLRRADGKGWSQIMQPYFKSQNVFQCPSNPRKDNKFVDDIVGYTSYAANVLGGIRDCSPSECSVTLAQYVSPASAILIVESTALYSDFKVDRNASCPGDYFCRNDSSDGGHLFASHTSNSNFLFSDGHVKAMRPLATLGVDDGGSATDNMWRFDNDSIYHAQSINGGPAEPGPGNQGRPYQHLAYAVSVSG